MKRKIFIIKIIFSIGCGLLYADPIVVGKAVLVKGRAERVTTFNQRAVLQEGSSLYQKDVIVTAAESSVKIVLQDMTELNVGPATKFVVEDFNRNDTSLFGMLYGSVRAKFSKTTTDRPKAILRTKSATMGVRGTDFQAVYHATTQLTSVVTFEGLVAMTKSEGNEGGSSATLQTLVAQFQNSTKTVEVSPGQFSGMTPAQSIPTIPVKISPAQFEVLKNDAAGAATTGRQGPGVAGASPAPLISPIPPGIDAKLLVSSADETKQQITNSGGATLAASPVPVAPTPPPEGTMTASGQFAPPAGGYVDLRTGVYVPPPPGSAFDAVAGVYVPPPNVGTVNPQTGAYVPPPNTVLDPQRGLIPVGAPPLTGAAAVNAANALPLAGLNPNQIGQTMAAAPPPVGVSALQYMTTAGVIPPPATVIATPAIMTGQFSGGYYGVLPAGTGQYPNYNGLQPMYPVYSPFLCPPYCDPRFQPGDYLGNPLSSGATNVSFQLTI